MPEKPIVEKEKIDIGKCGESAKKILEFSFPYVWDQMSDDEIKLSRDYFVLGSTCTLLTLVKGLGLSESDTTKLHDFVDRVFKDHKETKHE